MGNIPIIHEVSTSFMSLGDAITGNPEKARQRWHDYAKESVIGSYGAAVAEAIKGNDEKAEEYLKGMGRATGKAVLLGGVFRDVSVFHELAVCGESLGDVIGGGDTESARRRWGKYVESSVIGGTVCAIKAECDSDYERAEKLANGALKATLKFGATAAGVGVTVATGGLAAPLGVGVSVATGAVVGGVSGAGTCAIGQVIDKGKVEDVGAVVGSGLFGGTVGAITEARTAKNAAKAKSQATESGSKAKSQAPASKRSRAPSESFSSEAELFSNDSTELTRPRENSFSFNGGKARRHGEFENVWKPKDSGNMLDHTAAKEASRQDIQGIVGRLSNKKRSGKICVTQDTKTGDAFGSAPVKGSKRHRLHETMDSKQTKILDSIPEETRGVGHGNCAEQVAVNDRRYYWQQSEDLFPKGRDIAVQAFGQASKGIYTLPGKPCGSCAVVLKQFGQLTKVSKQLNMNSDVMTHMIAAGFTVGCQHCEEHQDCKECQD